MSSQTRRATIPQIIMGYVVFIVVHVAMIAFGAMIVFTGTLTIGLAIERILLGSPEQREWRDILACQRDVRACGDSSFSEDTGDQAIPPF